MGAEVCGVQMDSRLCYAALLILQNPVPHLKIYLGLPERCSLPSCQDTANSYNG